MDSFAKEKLLPSCVHGKAAPAAFQQALNDAITAFVVDKNADTLVKALVRQLRKPRWPSNTSTLIPMVGSV
jgi:hypothetical protein